MSYFGQGWVPRRAPQPRWQESGDGAGQDDEDGEYDYMDRGARGRGGQEQGRDLGYRPPGAGYRGGGVGFAERRQQEQERGQAWGQGQGTRGGDGLARGRQGQMGHRDGWQPGGRGGGGRQCRHRLTTNSGYAES